MVLISIILFAGEQMQYTVKISHKSKSFENFGNVGNLKSQLTDNSALQRDLMNYPSLVSIFAELEYSYFGRQKHPTRGADA